MEQRNNVQTLLALGVLGHDPCYALETLQVCANAMATSLAQRVQLGACSYQGLFIPTDNISIEVGR